MQRLLFIVAKGAISILLLYISLRKVDIGSIGTVLVHLDLRWIPLTLGALCLQSVLLALRWRDVIAVCGAYLPLIKSLKFIFIGQFFSQVLPSSVGGDAVRIWLLARSSSGWTPAVHSVLIDRLIGISILAIIVTACLPWTFGIIREPIAFTALALIGVGALAATLAFLAIGILPLPILDRWWITRQSVIAARAGTRLFTSGFGVRAIVVTFPIHILTVMAAWAAAMTAHAAVDFAHNLFLVLPVILVATLPISVAGWGLRESAMIAAFSYSGLASSDGLIISILFGAASLAVGVIGGIFWAFSDHKQASVDTMTTED